MQRMTVVFEGRVQGVGFRATVQDLAANFPVLGRVRNMRDGSVELVAEGDLEELRRFCDSVRERMERNIVCHREAWREIPSATCSNFGIAPSE